ncbi:MAG: glycosyltransferase family 2 protein [Bacteroidota bacterium]
MISICIPVYNFDVSRLAEELARQMSGLAAESELILIDDCSSPEFRMLHASLALKHRYIELPQNVGRSKIRNLFLEYARFDYLLFLDCDSLLPSPGFLKTYLEEMKQQPDVISGGRIYPREKPGKDRLLSWKFGVERESKSAAERRKDPNKSFMTNNFVIRKSLLAEIRFDENLQGYGHEDTLFGIALAERRIPVTHIENPVLNGDIETNALFLQKTEEGLKNLVLIEHNSADAGILHRYVSLLAFYDQLKRKKLLRIVLLFYRVFKKPIRRSLEKGYVSLRLFSLYKLGFYAGLRR